jgi:PucR C-terminal helix-turn-helix domain
VNTLYQRLDRIGALLDRPWQDAEVGLQLHLALTIRRLAALDQGG